MKILKSEKYAYKQVIKNSQIDPNTWHSKLQKVIEVVHQGGDIDTAILQEFPGFSPIQIQQVKDYAMGALGQSVPMA